MQRDTMFSSETGIHYTPPDVIERARAVMNGIDLDPASDATANRTVKAERYYADQHTADAATRADLKCAGYHGLALAWNCRSVWLNPPFTVEARDAAGNVVLSDRTGKPIRQRIIGEWVMRWRMMCNSAPDGAMLLVPARTDTEWYQPLFGLAMCFISGRLKFSEAKAGAPFPTCIIYAGPNTDFFYTLFDEIGECGRFTR